MFNLVFQLFENIFENIILINSFFNCLLIIKVFKVK